MESFLLFFKDYGSQISAVVATFAFVFGIYKFQSERKTTLFWKEFDVYHKLVKELVEPPGEGALFIDRQTAIIFEMRNFKRYFPYTLRLLKGLQQKWSSTEAPFPNLLKELELTIDYVEKKSNKWF